MFTTWTPKDWLGFVLRLVSVYLIYQGITGMIGFLIVGRPSQMFWNAALLGLAGWLGLRFAGAIAAWCYRAEP